MVDNKYAIAYSEVLEILKHIPIEDYNKIPSSKIELYETNASMDYKFNYDPSKTLEEQDVSDITKGIIILLFRDYWATELQRNKIIAKQKYDRMKSEEEKKARYNSDVFSNNPQKDPYVEEAALSETDDIKWYKKIWRCIKRFLRR